jgi:hypothetical protein
MNSMTLPPSRRRWRDLARAGTVLSAAMLGFSVLSAVTATALPAGTAPTAGQTISPTSGNSETEITLALTSPDNLCPGDTATGNYRWNTYMVPASADPATLTYNSSGPVSPSAEVVARPLYSALGGSPQVNKNTAISTGQIVGTSTVSFAVWAPGDIAPGTYEIGFACTKAPALGQPAQTERFWQTTIEITADAATGGAAQVSWQVAEAAPTTTIAPAATTTIAGGATTTIPGGTTTIPGGTTTTIAGATTTTIAGATTTTIAGATTTTVFASGGPTTTFPSGTATSGGSSSVGSGSTSIPVTGPSSTVRIVVWALLLLVFGRMAVLLARPVRVLPPVSR